MATHGLVAQSLAHNVVSDFWGRLEVAPCRVHDSPVRFGNFHSRLGVKVDGEITPATATITLKAWQDCAPIIADKSRPLWKGEQCVLTLEL